jgi:hypothetical protein
MRILILAVLPLMAFSACRTSDASNAAGNSNLASHGDIGSSGVKGGDHFSYSCQCAKGVSAKDCDHMPSINLDLTGKTAIVTFPDSERRYTGEWQSEKKDQALYRGFHSPNGFGDLGEAEADFDVFIDKDLLKGKKGQFIVRYHGQDRDWWDLSCK